MHRVPNFTVRSAAGTAERPQHNTVAFRMLAIETDLWIDLKDGILKNLPILLMLILCDFLLQKLFKSWRVLFKIPKMLWP